MFQLCGENIYDVGVGVFVCVCRGVVIDFTMHSLYDMKSRLGLFDAVSSTGRPSGPAGVAL